MIPTSENLTGVRPLQDGPEPDSVSAPLGDREAGIGVSEDAGRKEKDGAEEEVDYRDPWAEAMGIYDPANRAVLQKMLDNPIRVRNTWRRKFSRTAEIWLPRGFLNLLGLR